MKIVDAHQAALRAAKENGLSWDGDNAKFVVETLLPLLKLPDDVRQVLRWAYGYDDSDRSYEKESDGSSVVPDWFMLGLIKEPPGVGHDYINRVKNHTTPDGKKWSAWASNRWYYRAMKVFGYTRAHRVTRWLGLTVSIPFWWARGTKD